MRRPLLLIALLIAAFAGFMLWSAAATPVARTLTLGIAGWPANAQPMRLVLISDLHVAGPENPPARLSRVVEQVNALHPDLVLIAGDFVTEKRVATRHYDAVAAIAPLRKLRSRLGVFAVLGNHDHWLDGASVQAALAGDGIKLLSNDAVRAGPLTIGGVDDVFTEHAKPDETLAAMRPLGGIPILLSHSPDVFPEVPGWVPLTLAGHTHCGQIVLPFIGALATASRYGPRYRCGVIREGAKTLVVTAGIGTSILPFRLGAPSDLWLIKVGPRPPA